MKNYYSKLLPLILLINCLILPVYGSGNDETAPHISFIIGKCEIVRKTSGKSIKAKTGDTLSVGDIVKSGDDSHIEISLKNSVIRLNSNSKVKINKEYSEKKSTEIIQFLGEVWLKIKKLKGEDKNVLRTPTAICGVRGTAYNSKINEDKSTTVSVFEGEVSVKAVPWSKKTADNFWGFGEDGPEKMEKPYKEVSIEEFMKIISSDITITAKIDGTLSNPEKISKKKATKNEAEWINWNKERDKFFNKLYRNK